MFGYRREELIDQSLLMLIPDSDKKDHHKHVDEYYKTHESRKMVVERCLFGERKNKEKFPIEVSLNPFTIYDTDYVLALVFDQTEISKRDFKIKDLTEHLEKKIRTRTLELRETVAMLKKEIQRREEADVKIKFALQCERELNELKTKFLS